MKKYLKIIFLLIVLFYIKPIFSQELNQCYSPDSSLSVKIYSGKKIYYSIFDKNGHKIIENSPISLTLENGTVLGSNEKILSNKQTIINEEIINYFGKNNLIKSYCRELELIFEKNFTIKFRVYNNAFCYRFTTNIKQDIIIRDEEAAVRFPQNMDFYMPVDQTGESFYEIKDFFNIEVKSKIFLPLLLKPKIGNLSNQNVLITEADVIDYPSWLLKKSDDWLTNFEGYFSKYPIKFKQGGYLDYTPIPTQENNFIAKTKGNRDFPWRILFFPNSDAELLNNDLVYSLSRPSTPKEDWSWIKTGMCVWEYWHNLNLEGVDFETKQNTQTYISYLNFASQNKIPYMIVDWKWSNVHDIQHLNEDIDIKFICNEANKKNVKIILWVLAHTLYNDLNRNIGFITNLGASGIKVDFFDREDQLSNQMYENIANICAKNKLIVDFHGCSKPTGLHRKYPNILNYEAVKGNETNIFSTKPLDSKHHINCAFIRGAVGPLDFTPGSMHNVNITDYRPSTNNPVTVGTRMHELALLLLYDAPLQMLCDAPSSYDKEPQILKLISSLPTTWNKTIVVDAKIDHFVVLAKQKNRNWYISGITHQKYEKEITFNFLEKGNYTLEIYKDGINAVKSPKDYVVEKIEINSSSKYKLKMEMDGGIILKIVPI